MILASRRQGREGCDPRCSTRQHAEGNLLIDPRPHGKQAAAVDRDDPRAEPPPVVPEHEKLAGPDSDRVWLACRDGPARACWRGWRPRTAAAVSAERSCAAHLALEVDVDCLGEPRPTSKDVAYRGLNPVTVECKLMEEGVGPAHVRDCSRTTSVTATGRTPGRGAGRSGAP